MYDVYTYVYRPPFPSQASGANARPTLESKIYWALRHARTPRPSDKEVQENLAFFKQVKSIYLISFTETKKHSPNTGPGRRGPPIRRCKRTSRSSSRWNPSISISLFVMCCVCDLFFSLLTQRNTALALAHAQTMLYKSG